MNLDTPERRLFAAKQIIKQHPDALETQIRDCGGLDKKQASIELFQYWMREHDTIKSGSIVDYRKYVAEFLDHEGELTVSREELGNHKGAAVSKYEKFLDSELEFNKKTGDSSE